MKNFFNKINFISLIKKITNSEEEKYYHFTRYTFLKCIHLNFLAGFLLYIFAAVFIRIPVKEMIHSLFNPVFFISILVSIIGLITHTLITTRMASELTYWKLHGMNKLDASKLLKKVQIYPIIKGLETLCCFFICAIITSLFLLRSLNIDVKIAGIFMSFIFYTAYFYGILILNLTDKDCSSIAVEIVKSGVETDEAKLNYKLSNILSYMLYIGLPVILSTGLFFIVAKFSFTPIIIHSNGLIISRTLSELEQNGIFIKSLASQATILHQLAYISLLGITTVCITTIIYFKSTISHNDTIQKKLEELSEGKRELQPSNLPVNKYREISYTMHLLDRAILIFNRRLQNNFAIANTNIVNLNWLVNNANESIKLENNLSNLVIENQSKMSDLSFKPKINAKKIDEVVMISNKMINEIEIGQNELNDNIEVMKEITAANNSTISEIHNLTKKIAAIWDIVNLIDSISGQTKIIAFNAELEANSMDSDDERFHNIAKNIRSLADRTLELTSEIKRQINRVQHSANHLIATSNECMSKISEGNKISKEMENKFIEINKSIDETSHYSNITKDFLTKQTTYFQQISEGLNKISFTISDFKKTDNDLIETTEILRKLTNQLQDIEFNPTSKEMNI